MISRNPCDDLDAPKPDKKKINWLKASVAKADQR
jgi:hypothetical protein